MNAFPVALGGTITALGVGMVAASRYWPARVRDTDDSLLDELLGPKHPYTEFEHAPGVVRQGFNYCVPCGENTAGVLHADGTWTCGEYGNHPAGVA